MESVPPRLLGSSRHGATDSAHAGDAIGDDRSVPAVSGKDRKARRILSLTRFETADRGRLQGALNRVAQW